MSLNLDFISSEFNLSVVGDSGGLVYLFEGYRLDVRRRMLYRGEHEVILPPKAVETLTALIELRGEIVSKGDLMKIIWADTIVEESNLDHYLHVLRKTLGQKNDGQPFIETLRRRGYRFTSDVRVIEAPNRNGKRAADSKAVQFTDAETEDLYGSPASTAESLTAPVKIAKPSRFSSLLWNNRGSCCLNRVGYDLVVSAAVPPKPRDVESARRNLRYATDQRTRALRRDHFGGRKVLCLLRPG
jgi:DNA-binding winged helix-turn-helix (wHTH) protein